MNLLNIDCYSSFLHGTHGKQGCLLDVKCFVTDNLIGCNGDCLQPILVHVVAFLPQLVESGHSPATGWILTGSGNLLKHKLGFIAHSFSLSTCHHPDISEILFKMDIKSLAILGSYSILYLGVSDNFNHSTVEQIVLAENRLCRP